MCRSGCLYGSLVTDNKVSDRSDNWIIYDQFAPDTCRILYRIFLNIFIRFQARSYFPGTFLPNANKNIAYINDEINFCRNDPPSHSILSINLRRVSRQFYYKRWGFVQWRTQGGLRSQPPSLPNACLH